MNLFNKNMICFLNNALCIDNNIFFFSLLLIFIFYIWSNYYAISHKIIKKPYKNINIFLKNKKKNNIFQQRIHNKLTPPYKSNVSHIPINIPTRGEIPPFQQIGYIYDPNNNNDSQRFPLMSRPKWRGSTLYESYIIDGSRNSIKIPLSYNKQIQNKQSISIDSLPGNFIAHIYDYDLPRYIPYIY